MIPAFTIRSLPGMGATLTAEFLSEAGGTDRFPTADQLASEHAQKIRDMRLFAAAVTAPNDDAEHARNVDATLQTLRAYASPMPWGFG